MSFLIVLLIIVLVNLLSALRQIMAFPVVRALRIEDNPGALIHAQLQAQYDDAHAALGDMGFHLTHHAQMSLEPGFLLHAGVFRVYRSADGLTLAQVMSMLELEEADRCRVFLHSRSRDGTRYSTSGWDIFALAFGHADPCWHSQSAAYPDLAAQYAAHQAWTADKDCTPWPADSLALIAQGEADGLQWYYDAGYVRPHADGAGRLTLKAALRILRHAFARPAHSLAHADDVPPERLVLLWEVWKNRQNLSSPTRTAQWGLFIFSALLFMALGSWYWSALAAAQIGIIIFLHELGHWLAMRALGYRRVHMMLLPLAGGVTLGEEEPPDARDRAWVALFGPLPGIALAAILQISGLAESHPWLETATLFLIAINLFNLLPVLPLDGGHILQALFGHKALWLSQTFCGLSIIGVLLLAWWLGVAWFAVLALMPYTAWRNLRQQQQWLHAWQQHPPPENDMQARLLALRIVADPAKPQALARVMQAENLLKTINFRPMSLGDSGLIVALWLACFAILLTPQAQEWLRWVL